MGRIAGKPSAFRVALASVAMLGNLGCQTFRPCSQTCCGPTCPQHCRSTVPVEPSAPRELTKVVLPPYRIEPPDILQIDAIRVVPKSPYHLRMLDSLVIQVQNALPDAPIAGTF